MIPLELSSFESLGRLEKRADTIAGVKIDSRKVDEGDLFVAIGAGEQFVVDALARGAAAVLVPEDGHAAMGVIGNAVRRRSTAKIVAITGSTGKTTTKDILAALCAPHLRTVASEANYNNELGVPLTLSRIEPDTELCIVELAMRGPGEIAWLASIAQPDIAVITNIGPVHLEFLGDVENVARAKAELIEALPPGGFAVVPDEPLLEPHLQRRDDIEVRRFAKAVPFETSFTAKHQLDNTRAAIAVCEVLGVPLPERLEVAFTPLREEEIELADGVLLLNDCYNANPLSMRAALLNLAERAGERRRIAVLGEMAELGPDAPDYHEDVGRLAAELGVDVIGVGPLAVAYGGRLVATAADAGAAIAEALRPGDVVLVKGSRSVGLEAVAAKLVGR